MSVRKVADYQIAQDSGAGWVLFKLINTNGSITAWIGWKYIPLAQLGSLHQIFMTGNAFYDDVNDRFFAGNHHLVDGKATKKTFTVNPKGVTPIHKAKSDKS